MLAVLFSSISTGKDILAKLFSQLTIILNDEEQNSFLQKLTITKSPQVISFINAHAFNLVQTDKEFAKHLFKSNYILRDGVGLSMLLRLNNTQPGLNMNGTDFIPTILQYFKGKKTVLLGTNETNLALAKDRLVTNGMNITQTMNGFRPDSDYFELIKDSKPEIILLGMGMPKQERIAALLMDSLDYPCIIINGGASIDYISGNVPRAPKWVRKLRFEWLFRMVAEPKRLSKRYLLGNPIFLLRMICLTITRKFF